VCVVIAPSLIPRKPGDRIKTDRRDDASWLNCIRLWLRSLRFEQEADQVVLDDYLLSHGLLAQGGSPARPYWRKNSCASGARWVASTTCVPTAAPPHA